MSAATDLIATAADLWPAGQEPSADILDDLVLAAGEGGERVPSRRSLTCGSRVWPLGGGTKCGWKRSRARTDHGASGRLRRQSSPASARR